MGQAGSSALSGKRVMTHDELENVVSYLDQQMTALFRHAERLSTNQNRGWIEEYSKFAAIQGVAHASFTEENVNKNRYRNISAYDHTRVKITPNPHNGMSDYVNANYIPGETKYIAAQGPVPESFYAFWQMVWETKVDVIAMVTNEIEGGKLKCHRYWPEEQNSELKLGNLRIISGPARDTATHICKHFMLQNMDTNESREIVHLRYTAWPDHGVPESASAMLSFRKAILKLQKSDTLLIHCSAGVGRTGTYIAIDTLVRRLEAGAPNLDPCAVVTEMRRARNFMVQTLVQYQFVFKALLEVINKYLLRAKKALAEVKGRADEAAREAERALELKDIEAELQEAEDNFANLTGIDEQVEQLVNESLAKQGTGVAASSSADFRHAYKQGSDKEVASKITQKQRLESLMDYITSDEWRKTVEAPTIDANAPLSARVHSLQREVKNAQETWRKDYANQEQDFSAKQAHGGEEYDVSQSFTPLESRILALAQQREVMALKSDDVRRKMEEEEFARITSLTHRIKSLASERLEDRTKWADRPRKSGTTADLADGSAGVQIESLRERLLRMAMARDDWKSKGDSFGRVVANPVQPAPPGPSFEEMEAQLKAEEEAAEAAHQAELERMRQAEEERRRNEKPVQSAVYERKDAVVTPQVQLRAAQNGAQKGGAEHPMIAAAKAAQARHPHARS
ncbi:uncharacterized protein MONBRDRAFT_26140 [Monosiga brevicollis MX1]|uniref:protein-tyrosine-phosphatase n=1 Tax=Monosiga brevicollis TaxID=81824 RepID=A9V1H0_MONBE|nr:uncharacterized protein MONBRDRAFT_26140 [Monosiga brevicollis MX1]EDQ88438.1 predicted protein [Monosiga brevicollis MX1]|eukprot:XP_001746542.1 hypothetical protein [Monosiga brevicollis MX1]